MADSSSSSDSSTSSNLEEAFENNAYAEEVEPFMGIQPWRFEPPGRNEEFVPYGMVLNYGGREFVCSDKLMSCCLLFYLLM